MVPETGADVEAGLDAQVGAEEPEEDMDLEDIANL